MLKRQDKKFRIGYTFFARNNHIIQHFLANFIMKPKRSKQQNQQSSLFQPELSHIITPPHSLVKLSKSINWETLDESFAKSYCSGNGGSALSTRLMASLHYLKYTFDLSDEDILTDWAGNPYRQYLSRMKYFEHEFPIHPSSMTRWQKLIENSGAEELLKQTIRKYQKL